MIRIWKYQDAPQHLRDLEPDAGSGWWVLESPAQLAHEVEGVLQVSSSTSTSCHGLPDGTIVFFGRSLSNLLQHVAEPLGESEEGNA